MKVELIDYHDNWQSVKDATLNTIGKETGKYPDSNWKLRILRAEHSPIRLLYFTLRFTQIPYFVVMHLVRHHEGVNHFVSTQRTDRTGVDRNKLQQDNPISYRMNANAQALINISRKRLCNCAAIETRQAWQMVKDQIAQVEPELASCMVRECVYRAHCPEMFGCGFDKTEAFKKELEEYRNYGQTGTT